MPRPPKADRANVMSVNLGIKLSPSDRELLHRLVAARAEEASQLLGQRVEVTAASYIRWLMLRDAEARGLSKDPEPVDLFGGLSPQQAAGAKAEADANAKAASRKRPAVAKPAKAAKAAKKPVKPKASSIGAFVATFEKAYPQKG